MFGPNFKNKFLKGGVENRSFLSRFVFNDQHNSYYSKKPQMQPKLFRIAFETVALTSARAIILSHHLHQKSILVFCFHKNLLIEILEIKLMTL